MAETKNKLAELRKKYGFSETGETSENVDARITALREKYGTAKLEVEVTKGEPAKAIGGFSEDRTVAGGGRNSRAYSEVLKADDFASTVASMRENRFRASDLIPKFDNMGARGVVNAIRTDTLDTMQKQYSYLTDEQKNILLYYGGKGEWDKATEYLEFLEDELNERAAQEQRKQMT